MDVTAPEKASRIQTEERPSNVVDFTSRHKKHLIQNVVQETQKVAPFFKEEDATFHASEPVPNSPALKEVGAERVDAEPVIDTADITDIMGKTAGHVVGLASDKGSLTHVETVSGKKAVLSMRKRASLLEEEEGKAA